MEMQILVAVILLIGVAVGCYIRHSEITTLKDALRLREEENVNLQQLLNYKNHLPNSYTEKAREQSRINKPAVTGGRYDDGPPKPLSELRNEWKPE